MTSPRHFLLRFGDVFNRKSALQIGSLVFPKQGGVTASDSSTFDHSLCNLSHIRPFNFKEVRAVVPQDVVFGGF